MAVTAVAGGLAATPAGGMDAAAPIVQPRHAGDVGRPASIVGRPRACYDGRWAAGHSRPRWRWPSARR
jgi:hypothetical protein